jgi:hypothetical protein
MERILAYSLPHRAQVRSECSVTYNILLLLLLLLLVLFVAVFPFCVFVRSSCLGCEWIVGNRGNGN